MTSSDTGIKASGWIVNLAVRTKISLLLLIFGLIPATSMLVILELQSFGFPSKLSSNLAITSRSIVDVIDRNLFERYGDVQAFGLNTAATEQISSMIGAIQSSTGNSVQAIEGIGGVIGEINSMATIIASAGEEQNAITQEIARAAGSVSTDADVVLDRVGVLTLSAARSSGKSVQMLGQAKTLDTTMISFRKEIESFLNSS